MRNYIATSKAGRRISGQPNPGVGNPIRLTEAQAAHELRMGTIVPADDAADRKAAAEKKPTRAERQARRERKANAAEPASADAAPGHAPAEAEAEA